MKYAIVIEKTGTGFSAYAPDVPGCGVSAPTVAEVKRLLTEALGFHFESLREHGEPVPPPISQPDFVDVSAA
jgi:predicted RNase H-like HicB family nuclease